MPQRTRKHILEDESKTAFRQAIPPDWIVREKSHDYGIDLEVEVVSKGGQLTGEVFLVQLKATDSERISTQTKIQFRCSTLLYFRSLRTPVLLVRWAAKTNLFYARWSNEVFFTIDSPRERNTVTVKFEEHHKLTDNFTSEFESKLQLICGQQARAYLTGLTFSFDHTFFDPLSPLIKAKPRIRKFVENASDHFRMVEHGPGTHFKFIIDKSSWTIEVFGAATLRIDIGLEPYPSDEEIVRILKIGLAICFLKAGYIIETVPILDAELPQCSGTDLERTLGHLVKSFGHISKNSCESIVNVILGDQPNSPILHLYVDLLSVISPHYRGDERVKLRQRIVVAPEYQEDEEFSAAQAYNLGNSLLGQSDYRGALKSYLRAARLNPDYRKRPYFNREIATCIFEIGHFVCATKFYRAALDYGDLNNTRAYLADALLWSGRYAESLSEFEEYRNTSSSPDPLWLLRENLLAANAVDNDLISQSRKIDASRVLADVSNVENQEDALLQLEKSLKLDFLNGLAWHNLGSSQMARGERYQGAMSYLCAATIQPWDLESWVLGIMNGFAKENGIHSTILLASLKFAIGEFGTDFEAAIQKTAERHDLPENSLTAILGMIEETKSTPLFPPRATKKTNEDNSENDFTSDSNLMQYAPIHITL